MRTFLEWLKIREGSASAPYIGPCIDTDNYIVMGACSERNTDAKNKKIRQGFVGHKKVKKYK